MDTPGGVETISNIQGAPRKTGDDPRILLLMPARHYRIASNTMSGGRKGHDTEHAWDMEMCPLLKTITNKESGGTVTWHVLQV